MQRGGFLKRFGKWDYRQGKWGQTSGSSPRGGLGLSEQAQYQFPWCPVPYSFLTCMSYVSSRLPLSLSSLHLLPLTHISQSCSTYFTFPGLNNSEGRGKEETKGRTLWPQRPLPHPFGRELLGMNKGAGVSVVPNMRMGEACKMGLEGGERARCGRRD